MEKPYVPDTLPLKGIDFNQFADQLGEASLSLGRFDGLLQSMVNPKVLLSPLTTQEAVLSSKIEGTETTLEEVLEAEAEYGDGLIPNDDITEVLNYRKAMGLAVEEMNSRPCSLNLIKRMHYILLDSVRGQDKGRGLFRRKQNWIGAPGTNLGEATYVPPEWQMVPEHLTNLENFIHDLDQNSLVKVAIAHAQFEVIHPFSDGNGRVGRILIPIILWENQVLSSPMFYMSAYLDHHRDEYMGRLQAISQSGDWIGWISFFLTAVQGQAQDNLKKAKSIMALYDETKRVLSDMRSSHGIRALDTLFDRPIFRTSGFVQRSGIPKHTAYRLLKRLEGKDVITTFRPGRGRTPAIWVFPNLLNAAEGRDVL